MNGSDPQELMTEIETFLRTGEAPPAAPEPAPEPTRASRVLPPSRPFQDFPGRPQEALLDRIRMGARRPPKWTPVRVACVLGLLVALVVLPVVFSDHSSKPANAISDQASTAPAGPGYTFLRVNPSGTPVRWNPCTPIYYQTVLAGAPSDVAVDLQLALDKISQATGMLFANSGSAPGSAPVQIEWSVEAGPSLSRAVPVEAVDQSSGDGVYVGGTLDISPAAAKLPQGFAPGGMGVLLLHALGGLVGLGGTSSPGEIMNTKVLHSGIDTFGAGDRAGLKRLGVESGCLTVPAGAPLVPAL